MASKTPWLRVNRARFLLALMILFALFARGNYLGELKSNPFYGYPIIDAAEYLGWGTAIAQGEFPWTRVHIHGPLYPHMLAVIFKFGGSPDWIYPLQFALGVLLLLILFYLGKRSEGRVPGILAAGMLLLYARELYFEGLVFATTLATFLTLAFVLLGVVFSTSSLRPRVWVLAGIALGLSAITRPTILIVAPFVLAYFWWRYGRRQALPIAAWFVLGSALVIGPVALRNIAIGDPVLVQGNGGTNFYLGNRAGADGLASVRPGVQWNDLERIGNEAGLIRATDRDRFYYARAWSEIKAHPGEAITRALKRVLYFWSGAEVDTSQSFPYFRNNSETLRWLFLPVGWITAIGLMGWLRYGFGRNRPLTFAGVVLLAYTFSALLFPFASRYRMPMVPIMALFAAAELYGIAKRWRKPDGMARIGVTVIALIVLNMPWAAPQRDLVRVELHLGKKYYDGKRYASSELYYAEALERYGEDPDLLNNIGLLKEAMGKTGEAEQWYRRAATAGPTHAKAIANLAGMHMQRGDIEGTLRELERALALEPRNPDFRNNHGAILLQMGRANEAIETLEKGRAAVAGHADLLINLSRAYETTGRYEDAKEAMALSVSIEARPAAFHMLGRLEERTGDPNAALQEYDRALSGGPYPPALRARGILLVRIGRSPEGIRDLRAYVAGNPDDKQAALYLRQAEGSP